MPENTGKEPKDIGDYYSLINTIIILINIIVFVLVDLSHSSTNSEWMLRCGAMYWPYFFENGEYYRLITSMFLHFGITHIFNNMLVLWFIGGTLEKLVGHIKYIFIYFLSGILAGCFSIGYNILIGQAPIAAGASGAIFGTSGALLYIILINKGKAEGLTRRQILIFLFLSLYSGFASQGVDNAAHIGGFISGFLLAVLLYRKPTPINYTSDWRDSSYDEN
ncbi:MAG: rhomboid family intramembrane serine protease [Velocimicrobium sp.]